MDIRLKELIAKALALANQIASVLPRQQDIPWDTCKAARWLVRAGIGSLEPLAPIDPIALEDLHAIDRQKSQLILNTEQFCSGFPANNALLWGARGTGKSSLIHALLNEFWPSGLRIVEVEKRHLNEIVEITNALKERPYRFLLVCDDLSFDASDDGYKELKSALEGSIFANLPNLLIYATSNRRHLVTESMQDNLASTHDHGELHESEATEEKISLSDRFGLWISFYQFNQDEYLEVVQKWLEKFAIESGQTIEWTPTLRKEALVWALNRGVRSGRTANHFARHYIGKILLNASSRQP